MPDILGWRCKLGIVAPSTNTVVQPEMDEMRPPGVTNHLGRIHIPNMALSGDDDFARLMALIGEETFLALDRVMTCAPDHVVMGMSAETFWDGRDGAEALKARMTAHCGVGVSMGSDASQAAIRRYGDIRRIAVLTPYMPVGDANVRRFFTESGFEVLAIEGLRCPSPTAIAEVPPARLIEACRRLDDPQVECVIQVGTNLPFARLAPMAEHWLDKPVLAINTCIYWHALRSNGVDDRIEGFGSLLREH